MPRPANAACEDGDACTVGDHCSGAGDVCVAGAPASCVGACLTGACDPGLGCAPRAATASCDDANACTTGDHCNGIDDTCVGAALSCDDGEPCTADGCNAATGCTHVASADGTACPGADACHEPASCVAGVCDPGPAISCDDGHACTYEPACDPSAGCAHEPLGGFDGVRCHVTQLRALLATMSGGTKRLRRALGAALDCVEAQATATDGATGEPRARHLRLARGCLGRFRARVTRARVLVDPLRTDLLHESADGRGALDAYFAP
jgi:hypothetical protein